MLTENRCDYVVGGLKNWSLLRRHVHLVESYCKRKFHGKIPPKESITNILRLAEEQSSDEEEEMLPHAKRRRTHENPSKSVLESYSVEFSNICVSNSSTSCSTSTPCSKKSNFSMRRCEPTTVEEEAQLELALQASSFGVQKANVPPLEQTGKEQISTKPTPNSVNHLNVNDAANPLMSLSHSNAPSADKQIV